MTEHIARAAPALSVVAGVVFIVAAFTMSRRNADVRRIKRRHHE